MRKSTKKPTLSHADVENAMHKFREQGGLIKRLPDQVVLKGAMVGGKFGVYEPVFDSSAGSGGGAAVASAGAEAAAAE
jgi:hypothetical protein